MYLLFDCNNFFASCEKVFRPDWSNRPLVVLSNNDGCVIARSAEAKALGFAMGEPYFKCRDKITQHKVVVCSANFALYADLSDRVMQILEEFLPDVQQYSIDEAFALVDDASPINWVELAHKLRRRIQRWTGIGVSVGIAPTKTLAKLANELAKKQPLHGGVLSLKTEEDWQPILQKTPIADIWGVGRKLAPRMMGLGIKTAAGLTQLDLMQIKSSFGVHGERIAMELRGTNCIDDTPASPRGQIMVSRSLKEGIEDFELLRDILCRFVEKAARTLRQEEMLASELSVILRTNPFDSAAGQYASSLSLPLPCPTDDNRHFAKAATAILEKIWRSGFGYKKIGVLLSGLIPLEEAQPTFENPNMGATPLMATLDRLQQAGLNIHFANHSKKEAWQRSFCSPNYTGNWGQIPEAW